MMALLALSELVTLWAGVLGPTGTSHCLEASADPRFADGGLALHLFAL